MILLILIIIYIKYLSYFGGHVDVYIPKKKTEHNLIYHYDVNSLYPTVMRNALYPGGEMLEFVGDPAP